MRIDIDWVEVFSNQLDRLHKNWPDAAYWIHVCHQQLLAAMLEKGD